MFHKAHRQNNAWPKRWLDRSAQFHYSGQIRPESFFQNYRTIDHTHRREEPTEERKEQNFVSNKLLNFFKLKFSFWRALDNDLGHWSTDQSEKVSMTNQKLTNRNTRLTQAFVKVRQKVWRATYMADVS